MVSNMHKTNKIVVLIVGILLLSLFFSGCSSQNQADLPQDNPETVKSRVITDMVGRKVELPETVNRIIALQASDVEILYALNAADLVVGIGEYCNYPEEARQEKVVLPSGSQTNIESIVALAPDVVIMGTMDQSQEQVDQLEKTGTKVIMTNAQNIDGVYEAIQLIGQVTGKEKEGEELIADMKNRFARLKERSAGKTGQKIYFEVSPLEYGLWTAGKNTFMQEITDLLGLENIFADVEGWAQISEEQVLSRDPQIIVTITMYFGEGPTPVEEILSRSGWQNVTAIKNKAVYNGDTDLLTRPGPRLAQGAEELLAFVEQIS